MIRINFQPYNTQQLMEIVSSRMATSREGLKADAPQVIAPDSLRLAAMKVASISGDARRVLDICRSVLPVPQYSSKSPLLRVHELTFMVVLCLPRCLDVRWNS